MLIAIFGGLFVILVVGVYAEFVHEAEIRDRYKRPE